MKAFILDRYGKGGGRIGEMPDPELRDEDVLVQVHAAGVNPLDAKIRNGEFKLLLPYRLPLILGNEVAGIVVRAGSRVRRFKPGDEVYARPPKDRIGAWQAELLEYVKAGGVVVAQYNTTGDLKTKQIGPFPLEISRDRVTDENAEVRILAPDHPVFRLSS